MYEERIIVLNFLIIKIVENANKKIIQSLKKDYDQTLQECKDLKKEIKYFKSHAKRYSKLLKSKSTDVNRKGYYEVNFFLIFRCLNYI